MIASDLSVPARPDALRAVVPYVVVLLGIPSVLIVKPLGAAGTPAQIIAIGMLAWWLASRVISRQLPERSNPIKWLMFLVSVAVLASYDLRRRITGAVEPTEDVIERSILEHQHDDVGDIGHTVGHCRSPWSYAIVTQMTHSLVHELRTKALIRA